MGLVKRCNYLILSRRNPAFALQKGAAQFAQLSTYGCKLWLRCSYILSSTVELRQVCIDLTQVLTTAMFA